MNPSSFWKNFRLGEELQISGTFIYNGLRRFHELRTLDFEDELFEILYELSVGLERLLKVAVVLYEHTDTTDQVELEKSLITHNHLHLVTRLRKYVDLKLGTPHNDLLNLLGTFYKSMRYDRFTLTSIYENDKEAKTMICGLLAKYLKVDFSNDSTFFVTGNDDQYRNFIQRTVLKVTREIYSAIEDRARRINLYTYELRSGSKAERVFLRELDVADEDVLWKELLVFFMNVKADTGYLQFLRETLPLGFDSALIPDYLNCFKSDSSKADVMDELEHLYSEMGRDERNERLRRMVVIGDPSVSFDDEDDEIDDMNQWGR